jgi:lipoate-protein ligase B
VLVLCTHPPVVTLGRGSRPEDLEGWSGSTLETSRGGRATYHGPSQVVIYPIVDLKRERSGRASRDVHAYLRALEELTVACLREAGLPSPEARTSQVGEISLTGVWVGAKKTASIGIAVRKWITYHGIAINVLNDASAFRGIRPCGFSSDIMTSLEAELGRPVDVGEFKHLVAATFSRGLSN